MTFSTKELRANGVPEDVIAMRVFRRANGLTLQQFAKLAGLSPDVISRAETGKRPLSSKAREKCDKAMRAVTAKQPAQQEPA